jgi:hypothetical protein
VRDLETQHQMASVQQQKHNEIVSTHIFNFLVKKTHLLIESFNNKTTNGSPVKFTIGENRTT